MSYILLILNNGEKKQQNLKKLPVSLQSAAWGGICMWSSMPTVGHTPHTWILTGSQYHVVFHAVSAFCESWMHCRMFHIQIAWNPNERVCAQLICHVYRILCRSADICAFPPNPDAVSSMDAMQWIDKIDFKNKFQVNAISGLTIFIWRFNAVWLKKTLSQTLQWISSRFVIKCFIL